MRSNLPKVAHPVCGIPMVRHVVNAALELAPSRVVAVVGHQRDLVEETLEGANVEFASQEKQLGTGHALLCAREQLGDSARIMVLNGDVPLVTATLLQALSSAQESGAALAIATSAVSEAGRLGRLIRDEQGHAVAIVEAADYKGDDGPAEINAGQYVFDADWLWSHIGDLPVSASGERYLTELIALAAAEGQFAKTVEASYDEILGVDDRRLLARAEQLMRARLLDEHMLNGVTIHDPGSTYIDASVEIEPDVTILPGCNFYKDTRIASGAVIGPASTLRNAQIGADTTVQSSVIEDSSVGANCQIGPFAHLRGRAQIGDNCELGNYSEVKNSVIGPGVKMHHFSYIGDADVGAGANIAAGTVTCNYDGAHKHRTVIGRDAFIGCDTMLVAPVEIGDEGFTAAGSVVTKDVPAGGRVAGVPAKPLPRSDGTGQN